MGTIVDKFNYSFEAKDLIKDSINNLGGSITSETELKEYAQELDNIYDNLPKTTGEGTNLSLTTLKGKMNIIPKGDTKQTQYSGINLCEAKMPTTTLNGIMVTNNNNGTYTISGTSTSSTTMTLRLNQSAYNGADNLQNYSAGTYTLDLGITSDKVGIRVMQNGTFSDIIRVNPSTRLVSSTIQDTNNTFIVLIVVANASFSTPVTIKPMLVKGSYTESTIPSFEPYVGGTASPNPTYPQNIEVVTGTQEVKVENKNLTYIEAEGKFRANATGEFVINAAFNSYIASVKPNTTYISSAKDIATQYTYITNLCYFDKNMTYISGSAYNTANKEFTTPNNCYYVTIAVNTNAENVQLEKGSTATTYVEHQEQTQTISLGDIELCKIGNYQDYLYKTNGKNLLDMSKFQEHYTIDSNGLPAYNGGQTRITNTTPINVEGIEKVTLTCTLNGKSFIYSLLNADNTLVSRVAGNSSGTTITIGQAKYLYICFYDNATLSNITDAMLVNGSTALPYEPYGSDKWYKKEQIGKVILNGSENWVKSNTRFHTAIPSANGNYVVGALCREYIEVSTHDIHANTNYSFIVCNSGWGIDHCRISFNNSDYASVDSWKNALATNNIVVYYQLTNELGGANDIEITDTTLIEQLDNLEKMKSYNGTTNISSSGSLPMILNVSAIKGES